jgi:hypothetical protein
LKHPTIEPKGSDFDSLGGNIRNVLSKNAEFSRTIEYEGNDKRARKWTLENKHTDMKMKIDIAEKLLSDEMEVDMYVEPAATVIGRFDNGTFRVLIKGSTVEIQLRYKETKANFPMLLAKFNIENYTDL